MFVHIYLLIFPDQPFLYTTVYWLYYCIGSQSMYYVILLQQQ